MGRFRIGVWQRYASAKGDGLLSALALALLRPILVVWVPAKRCWTQRPGLDLAGATHIQPIAAGSDLMWERTGLSRERDHDANLFVLQQCISGAAPKAPHDKNAYLKFHRFLT